MCVICATLLGLQLLTATSWDFAVNGEAGTVVGVGVTAWLLEWARRG